MSNQKRILLYNTVSDNKNHHLFFCCTKKTCFLADFKAKMDGYVKLKAEINGIRNFALLNMFELDCMYLNKEMSDRCVNLRTSLIRPVLLLGHTFLRHFTVTYGSLVFL